MLLQCLPLVVQVSRCTESLGRKKLPVGLLHLWGLQHGSVPALQQEGIVRRWELQELHTGLRIWCSIWRTSTLNYTKSFNKQVEVQDAATSSSSPAPFSKYYFKKVEIAHESRILIMHTYSVFTGEYIGDLIALGSQPFSAAEDHGFRQLIRNWKWGIHCLAENRNIGSILDSNIRNWIIGQNPISVQLYSCAHNIQYTKCTSNPLNTTNMTGTSCYND